MKQRFRLYRRNGGIYYIHDDETGRQESLHTRERVEASALFAAKTQSYRQAHLNLRLARTYLAATDPMVRQSVISDAADLLHEAGDDAGAKRLLEAELKRSAAPYYYMLDLASLAEDENDGPAAIAWAKDLGRTQMLVASLGGPLKPTMDDVKRAADELDGAAKTMEDRARAMSDKSAQAGARVALDSAERSMSASVASTVSRALICDATSLKATIRRPLSM